MQEISNWIEAEDDENRAICISTIYSRLGLEVPADSAGGPAVRVMTMHGAKGLDGQIVFIPGLEDGLLPNMHQKRFPGLFLEAARLLYVSVTRARAVCVLSYASNRLIHGAPSSQHPSNFCSALGGTFAYGNDVLNDEEIGEIMEICKLL